MKILSVIALLLFYTSGFSQSCENPFYVNGDAVYFEMTNYDKKDKPNIITQYHTKSNVSSASGSTMTFLTKMFDEKNKPIAESEFIATCSDGTYRIDMSSLSLTGAMSAMAEMDGMQMSVSGDDMEVPSSLSIGMSLPDANSTISFSGPMDMSFTTTFTNRKVVAKETLALPFGSVEAFRVEHTQTSSMGFRDESMKVIQWYAEGYGLVKQEMYKENGKYMGKVEMTAFRK